MVIMMNIEIINGKNELVNENYEKAIKHFNKVGEDDEFFDFAQYLNATALKKLEKYREALSIFDDMISKNPRDVLVWVEKVFCHIYLKEDEKARESLKEIDRIADRGDKILLITIFKLYDLIDDYDNALRYCNYVLDIDPNCKEALYQKISILSVNDGDEEELNLVCDKLMDISDGKLLSLMPVFLVKLFLGNYRDCLDIIGKFDEEVEYEKSIEMLKGALYNRMIDDLGINLLTFDIKELSVEDALSVLLDFVETGKNTGKINGIHYLII